jgi:hypothetical protein
MMLLSLHHFLQQSLGLLGILAFGTDRSSVFVEEEREGQACQSQEARDSGSPMDAQVAVHGCRAGISYKPAQITVQDLRVVKSGKAVRESTISRVLKRKICLPPTCTEQRS